LAEDVYLLRNQIAHGARIYGKYLEKGRFRLGSGAVHYIELSHRSFQVVLYEATLFMLCAALRRVILDDRFTLLRDQRIWERWLDH